MSLANIALLPGAGMILVACAALWYWRRVSGASARWFWIGAALWFVAVVIKSIIAILSNPVVLKAIKEYSSPAAFVATGGLFIGIESSLCEIGLTILAGLIWKRLGDNAGRAIAVGVGAGAFEAVVLGVANLAGTVAWRAGVPGTEPLGEMLRIAAASTPVFWLAGPVERVIAILVHAASRGLVLVGIRHARFGMIALGFLIFTLIDALTGGMQLSGSLGSVSLWWIELLLSSSAIVSIPSIWWLFRSFGGEKEKPDKSPASDVLE
jgi:hypothetical protein